MATTVTKESLPLVLPRQIHLTVKLSMNVVVFVVPLLSQREIER